MGSNTLPKLIARALVLVAALCAPAFAQAPAAPVDTTAPAQVGRAHDYVEDQAGVLSPAGKIAIERYCGKVERALGAQFAVVIVPGLGDERSRSSRSASQGGIGGRSWTRACCRDRVREHRMRFEVGYGLEARCPTAASAASSGDAATRVPRGRLRRRVLGGTGRGGEVRRRGQGPPAAFARQPAGARQARQQGDPVVVDPAAVHFHRDDRQFGGPGRARRARRRLDRSRVLRRRLGFGRRRLGRRRRRRFGQRIRGVRRRRFGGGGASGSW